MFISSAGHKLPLSPGASYRQHAPASMSRIACSPARRRPSPPPCAAVFPLSRQTPVMPNPSMGLMPRVEAQRSVHGFRCIGPMPLQFRWRTVGSRNPLRPRNRPRQATTARGFPGERAQGRGRRPPSTRCTCSGCAAGVKEGIPGCRQGSPAGSDTARRDATGPGGAIRAAGVERGIRKLPGPLSRRTGPRGRKCPGRRPRPGAAPGPRRPRKGGPAGPCSPARGVPRGTVGGSRAPGQAGRRAANPFPATGSQWPESPRVATDRGYSRAGGALYKMPAGRQGRFRRGAEGASRPVGAGWAGSARRRRGGGRTHAGRRGNRPRSECDPTHVR